MRLPLHVAHRRHRHRRTSALVAASSMRPRELTLRLPSSEHSPPPLLNALSPPALNALSPPTPSNNSAPDHNDNSPQTQLQPQADDRCRHGARPTDSSQPTLLPTPSGNTRRPHHGL